MDPYYIYNFTLTVSVFIDIVVSLETTLACKLLNGELSLKELSQGENSN